MMRPPKPKQTKGDYLLTEPNRPSLTNKRKENNNPSVIIEEAAPSHVTNMLEDIEGKSSQVDETYEEMFRDVGGRSRPIPALNGGVPIFQQVKNDMLSSKNIR
jgi:hypothetical protein